MNIKRNKLLSVIIVSSLLLLLVGILAYRQYWLNRAKQSIDNKSNENNSTQLESVNTNNPVDAGELTNKIPEKPKQPILTKSSGNNGPIPVGAVVNFLCSSEPNTTCHISLKNQSGEEIVLTEQKVLDNGRNEYFTQWYWSSIQGSWDIVAISKNEKGGTNSSQKQTLVVK